MQIKSSFRNSFFLFSFGVSTILFGTSSNWGWADPIEDALASKVAEFSSTQETLYQGFVNLVFSRYCSSQYPTINSKMRELNSENPLDAWVTKLSERDPDFMSLFEDCLNRNLVLNICDEFVLNVPEFFARETLPQAEIILRDPDRTNSLDERILEVDAFIQADIQKDYTAEKLLARLQLIVAQPHFAGDIPPASRKNGKKHCTAKGCHTKVLARDLNPFACSFCEGNHCPKHRYLEAHDCPGLEAHKAQNREKLFKQNPKIEAIKLPKL